MIQRAKGRFLGEIAQPDVSKNQIVDDTLTKRLIPGKGAVIFLLDRSYLTPLRVFAYSLRYALEDRTEDIVVITNDQAVAEDEFVKNFADRVEVLGPEQVAKLRLVNSSRVSKKFRRKELGAYWFLKFYVFADLGYDYHLFFDSDMLCVNPNFRFADVRSDADLSVAPTIGPSALGMIGGAAGTDLGRKAVRNRIYRMADTDFSKSRLINSGLLYIGQAALGKGTVTGLIRLASEHEFRYDQDAIRRYMELRGDLSFRSMPIWFNFSELPARALGEKMFRTDILEKVSIVHFNRLPKPWSKRSGDDWLHQMWWSAHDAALDWLPPSRPS